jgi:hypothetical protein
MDREQRTLIRRRSMQGTALFVLGIAAAIAAVVIGSVVLGVVALAMLLPSILILSRVGRNLP